MRPYQLFITGLIAWLTASTCLTARTIMLDDPRPGIVQIDASIVFEAFANGKQVGRFVNFPTTTRRDGILSVNSEEITLSGWEIDTASATSVGSFDLNGTTYAVTIDKAPWASRLLDSFSSRIEGGEQKSLLTPPTLEDLHAPPFEGRITVSGATGQQTLDFAMGFDQGQVLGGRHVTPNSEIRVYSIGLFAKRETPYIVNVDGRQVDFHLYTQLTIVIAPEPGFGTFWWAFLYLSMQIRRSKSQRVASCARR